MAEPDLLFAVRNHFFLGAYQAAIAEAADLEGLSETEKVERDCYVYRSYIELGSYELVINEVSGHSAQALQAVKILAQYMANKTPKEEILATLASWVVDPACAGNATTLTVAGLIYTSEENFVEALKACHTGLSLEMMAVSVQCYLKIDRVDQAEKQLKAMSALDDDATLTQLATAWVDLFLGGAKASEAAVIYQELGERHNWTVPLYNGAAACAMQLGNWEEAEQYLQANCLPTDAYEKDAKNADTLANLVVVGLHLGKNTSRFSNQLKTVAPTHVAVKRLDGAYEAFDRAAAGFVAA
ncbi:hypothetical protein CVIRNUC_001579 [Coccomyxa viridis]|uniref:Coatomer subunit epsilon n=1 Tax=Coccomyxa viridis TaxID=1274662 RepID=A0AAV1HTB7_9CHLO|nr:hypothetical protein CVIRNUC_001579 [Coccomyxa viridis]